ncbi:L-threonylcarbamoyladenylate synthase [Alteromonas sp. A079]|uniref:L-threonylcarbamoyladenylate synthase n=1 Tax=Alteromonas sp. A079 TaxID=3410268 RepID=UPI003B9DD85D
MQYNTQVLRFPNDIKCAAQLIADGECVAVKTETVYGLAANAADANAVARIFEAKARPATNPLIVHIASIEDINKWAKEVPDVAFTLAERFWPGPLSLLLKKQRWVPDSVTGGQDSIVLRMPASEDFLSLIKETGLGLAAPSANKYKFISPTSAQHVLTSLDGRIAAVIDGGQAEVGIESTIVDVTGSSISILRPGPINDEQLSYTLGLNVSYSEKAGVTVPGSVKQHYQPVTPVALQSTDAIIEYFRHSHSPLTPPTNKRVGFITHSEIARENSVLDASCITLGDSPEQYAAQLYAALHTLDEQGLSRIIIESLPDTDSWHAINNRVRRIVA